jgi:hypothetical protein
MCAIPHSKRRIISGQNRELSLRWVIELSSRIVVNNYRDNIRIYYYSGDELGIQIKIVFIGNELQILRTYKCRSLAMPKCKVLCLHQSQEDDMVRQACTEFIEVLIQGSQI